MDENIPDVLIADPLRLNQIFMNLLSNAIKFTYEGKIIFRAEILAIKNNKAHLKFSVIDSGIGISKLNLLKIFDKFEQVEDQKNSHHGGTGLGLAIVKKLVELKGGILNIESKVGKGSTFSFNKWYNYKAFDPVKNKEIAEDSFPSLKGMRILIAEDNMINKYIILNILDKWEVETQLVNNGLEVLEILKDNTYNLILMDNYMPGMNGLEVISKIRSGHLVDKKDIPIIMITAGILAIDREHSFKAGANDILIKPFVVSDLYQKISLYK